MTIVEKRLYHQIHPIKLFTDWATGFIALYYLWIHMLLFAIFIAIFPSIVISLVLVNWSDLRKLKKSAFGRYVKKYMTKVMELLRLLGYLLMAMSAWNHFIIGVSLGLFIILFAWLYGLLFEIVPFKNN